jgi:magnesium transporter
MFTSFIYNQKEIKKIKTSEIKNHIGKKSDILWINIQNAENEDISMLRTIFDIHPTTIEDIFSQQTPIKYEDFDDYKVIIFKGIRDMRKRNVTTYNISFIISKNFVITISGGKEGTINDLLKNEKKIESLLKRGKKHLVHYIIDKEVDKCVQIRAELNQELSKLEIEFMKSQGKEILSKIYSKELIFLELRQLSEAVTDLCLNLTKTSEHHEDKNLIPYFKDVYDHALKTTKSYQTMIERMTGMEEMYATMTSMKTNEVMRSLTIIMALMMPLTIITGFYGMNVPLPFQTQNIAWILLLGTMILSAIAMIIISKKAGWISKGLK